MALWTMVDEAAGAPKNNLMSVSATGGQPANGSVLYGNTQVGAFYANVAVGVFGIDAREKSNAQFEGPIATHAGWVLRKQGSGGLVSVTITDPGKGLTGNATAKYLTITGGGLSNTQANASFTVRANGSIDSVLPAAGPVANGVGYAQNGFCSITNGGTGNNGLANISYTKNAAGNIALLTINNGGANFDSNPVVVPLGTNTGVATIVVTTNTGVITAVTVAVPGSYTNTATLVIAPETLTYNTLPTFAGVLGGRANRVHYEVLVASGSMGYDNVANTDDATVGA